MGYCGGHVVALQIAMALFITRSTGGQAIDMVIEIESESRSLEEIATDIADRIAYSRMDTNRTRELLIEFANEIKRQSIEP